MLNVESIIDNYTLLFLPWDASSAEFSSNSSKDFNILKTRFYRFTYFKSASISKQFSMH